MRFRLVPVLRILLPSMVHCHIAIMIHFTISFVCGGYVISASLLISHFHLNVRPPLCKRFTCIFFFFHAGSYVLFSK